MSVYLSLIPDAITEQDWVISKTKRFILVQEVCEHSARIFSAFGRALRHHLIVERHVTRQSKSSGAC